jgi:steroid delta-isomerase-like uncharacterized protein
MTHHELNTEESNRAAAIRLYEECLNRGNLEIIDQIVSPGFVNPGPAGGVGPADFKDNITHMRAAFPDIHFTVHDTTAEKDRVAVAWTWEGTHRGNFANTPPTGNHVRLDGVIVYHFKEGKITAARSSIDRLAVLQQLGVKTIPPAGPRAARPQNS